MKRFVTVVVAAVLLVAGASVPLDVGSQTAAAEAYEFIGYSVGDVFTGIGGYNGYGDYDGAGSYNSTGGDFASYYQSNRFSITGDSERTLRKGKTLKLSLSRSVSGVKWSSSNLKVASVNSSGKVKAKKPGKAVITALDPSTGLSASCTVGVYRKRTQAQARKAILKLKATYPEGRRWTNDNRYDWEAAKMSCYGCAAFAGIASDKAFGKHAPFKTHRDFSKVKAGDSIRIGNWHSVVVLRKKGDVVTVCEGNYNDSIHWGATFTRSYLESEGYEIWTRY